MFIRFLFNFKNNSNYNIITVYILSIRYIKIFFITFYLVYKKRKKQTFRNLR